MTNHAVTLSADRDFAEQLNELLRKNPTWRLLDTRPVRDLVSPSLQVMTVKVVAIFQPTTEEPFQR